MDSYQKSVTLTKCKIYNSNLAPNHPICLVIKDTTNNTLFQKAYHPQINQNHIAITLAIKLTFSLEETQVFLSFWQPNEAESTQKVISFRVEFQKLTGDQNFFTADFNNCIVNLITKPQRAYNIPKITARTKSDQVEQFIKQREEYLLKVKKEHCSKEKDRKSQKSQQASSSINQCTPYFQKKPNQADFLSNKSHKIKELLARARNLSSQELFVIPKPQDFKQILRIPIGQSHSTPYQQFGFQKQRQQRNFQTLSHYNQSKPLTVSHLHEHIHYFGKNEPETGIKRGVQHPRQSRTNDSYSAFSSQSQEAGERPNKIKSRVFDARSPFKHNYL